MIITGSIGHAVYNARVDKNFCGVAILQTDRYSERKYYLYGKEATIEEYRKYGLILKLSGLNNNGTK